MIIGSYVLGSNKIDIKKRFKNLGAKKVSELIDKTVVRFIYESKNEENSLTLAIKAVKKLKLNSPDFFSVTYGTGNGVADLSLDTIKMLKSHTDKNIMAHITFSETSKHETLEIVSKLNEIGISSFLAIRGDSRFENKLSADNYFKDTVEFVETLKKTVSCDVSVAAYPDIHQS